MKTLIPICGFLASASAFTCGWKKCGITTGAFSFSTKYTGRKTENDKFKPTDYYDYEVEYNVDLSSLANDKVPLIKLSGKGGPSSNGRWKLKESGQWGDVKYDSTFKVNDDSISTDVTRNGDRTTAKLHGALVSAWILGYYSAANNEIKYEQNGPNGASHQVDINVVSMNTQGANIRVKAKIGEDEFVAENKIGVQIDAKQTYNAYTLSLDSKYKLNNVRKQYLGKLRAKVPDDLMKEDKTIAEQLKEDFLVIYMDKHCIGHNRCRITKKPKILFKVAVKDERIGIYFGTQFIDNYWPPKQIISMPDNPYDSVKPLVDQFQTIYESHMNCDINEFLNANNKVNYINNNKDKMICIKAAVFADEMIDILDDKHGINCNTVFTPQYIDIETDLPFYPTQVVKLCQEGVAQVKSFFPEMRSIMMSFLDNKTKNDLRNAF